MDFKTIIQNERQQPYYKELEAFVNQEYATKIIYPPRNRVFHCFNFQDYDDIKVVIIGQDPYMKNIKPMDWPLALSEGYKHHQVL